MYSKNFFYQSVNNFLALLLRKINVFDNFNIVDFFRFFIFQIILIESNFCL